MRRALLLLITTLFVTSCSPLHASLPIEHLILHRGNYSLYPGNTLQGIESGIRMGFSYIEIDVRQSRDGTFFLFHDYGVHRKNSIAPDSMLDKQVDDLSRQELAVLCSPKDKTLCAALFDDVISLAKGKDVTFFLDLKSLSPDLIKNLISYLKGKEFLSQVVFQCPSPDVARAIYAMAPSSKILVRIYNLAEIATALQVRPYAIQLDVPLIDEAVINQIHSGNSIVVTKTLDSNLESEKGISSVLEKGADLVLTDVLP